MLSRDRDDVGRAEVGLKPKLGRVCFTVNIMIRRVAVGARVRAEVERCQVDLRAFTKPEDVLQRIRGITGPDRRCRRDGA